MKRLFALLAFLLFASPVYAQNTWIGTLGSGARPSNSFGKEGDWFIDTNTYLLWGPKTSGAWPSSGIGTATTAILPAFSGDCTTSAGASALTCTKTGGAAFAAIATSGSASDLTTGTAAIGRLANVSFIVYRVSAVNFNAGTTDTTVPIILPTGATRYVVSSVRITNASASLSTATIGVFTGAGATGQTIAADQAITVTATAVDTVNNAMQLTLTNAATMAYNDASIFVRIGTAQGSAATGNVVITLNPL